MKGALVLVKRLVLDIGADRRGLQFIHWEKVNSGLIRMIEMDP